MLKAILNYQEIDRKLFQLEREIAGSPERKKYAKLKKYMEMASEKLDALDAKAESLRHEVATLEEKYAVTEAALVEFDHMEELVEEGGADLAFYKKKALMHLDRMKKLKGDIAALEESIKETDKEYKELKAEVIAKQAEYKTAKEEYAALKDSKEDAKKAIEIYKESDPSLYQSIYDCIVCETISPRYLLLELYSNRFSKMELAAFKAEFKADTNRLGFDQRSEHVGLSGYAD